MASLLIDKDTIILNQIIKHLRVEFSLQYMGNELKVSFDEEKMLNCLSKIASEYPRFHKDYTGVENHTPMIDRIRVRVGEYEFSGVPKMEVKHYNEFQGYVKEPK